MDNLTISTPLRGVCVSQQLANRANHCRWFASIPPERTGLHGEYDYYGLSKRVSQCLSRNVGGELRRLKVRQRGRVVVLSGRLGSPYQLREIVNWALSVDGVDEVETYGVRLQEAC